MGFSKRCAPPCVAFFWRLWGAETPRPPGPSVSPTQFATCRASGAFDSRRSSLWSRDRRFHARWPWPGLPPTTPSDPVGRPDGDPASRQHVADAGDPAVWPADHGESLEREGGTDAVSEKMLETLKIARHVAVEERDPAAHSDRSISSRKIFVSAATAAGRSAATRPASQLSRFSDTILWSGVFSGRRRS